MNHGTHGRVYMPRTGMTHEVKIFLSSAEHLRGLATSQSKRTAAMRLTLLVAVEDSSSHEQI